MANTRFSGQQSLLPQCSLAGSVVLVVEDEPLIAIDLAHVIQQLGCTLLGPCASAAEALAIIQRERPDAALLDVGLPDGPAASVADALAVAGIPFALITGYDPNTLLDASFADVPVLSKPFRLDAAAENDDEGSGEGEGDDTGDTGDGQG